MNDEFQALTPSQRNAVTKVIGVVRATGAYSDISIEDGGEAYAYPHGRGGIAWGFNRASDGFNVARGVTE